MNFPLSPLPSPLPAWFMPAEWEPQASVWLTWPLSEALWPGKLPLMQEKFAEIAAAISRFEQVSINAPKEAHAAISALIEQAGGAKTHIFLADHPANDVWCRDHGPIFVVERATGQLAVTDWQYNAWGGKFPPWDLDNDIPRRIAETLHLPRYTSTMILEGGSIEVNDTGTLITTEAVLLNPNRNLDWGKAEIEAEIKRYLGIREIFWLRAGIEGDDTDGHIDDMTRFIKEDALVTAVEKDSCDPNYRILMENRERLQGLRTTGGSSVQVIDLPMPEALRSNEEGWRLERLPASYANFLILNGAVLSPVFDQKKADDRALGILRECFPGRQVIGIDCRDLVWEGGALHCISQQQPEGGRPRG